MARQTGTVKRRVVERFMQHVKKDDSGCWIWTAYIRPNGYGRFMLAAGKAVYAHRFSFEMEKGTISGELCLDHLCRNRACVNPAHLEEVTRGENLRRSPLTLTTRNARKTHCPYRTCKSIRAKANTRGMTFTAYLGELEKCA